MKVEQNRKVEYRKSPGGRLYFSVVDGVERMTVTRVINKADECGISVFARASGLLVAGGILLDDEAYRDCAEEEFNKAYSDALAIVTMKKIPS